MQCNPFVAAMLVVGALLLPVTPAGAKVKLDKSSLTIHVGAAQQLKASAATEKMKWESSDPAIAAVYQNGYVIGIAPGTARVRLGVPGGGSDDAAECAVTVQYVEPPDVNPATLKQFPDSRRFEVDGRLCFGSELNGRRAVEPEERANTQSNRVINPKPLRPDRPLEWEVEEGTEIYDGAGILMGTVAPELKVNDRRVPTSKFNFGMSKILHGKLCVYAFSIPINPTPELAGRIDPEEMAGGTVGTSAWLPLDRVVEKEALVERVGVGKPKLPRLPLESRRFRVTGGNPKAYVLPAGELRIVKDPNAEPVPSHYLRRPSGTINVIYSVPGFGLGGQGLDSFLVDNNLTFRPAKGAKVFTQPTYFPGKHPRSGEVSPRTMTFLYGAVEAPGVEPVYGWIAREALAPDSSR